MNTWTAQSWWGLAIIGILVGCPWTGGETPLDPVDVPLNVPPLSVERRKLYDRLLVEDALDRIWVRQLIEELEAYLISRE